MKYDLKRPCPKCPFRVDIPGYLHRLRAVEIAGSVFGQQQDFPCHQTVDYSDGGEGFVPDDAQMCAGAMILAEKVERPTQMMRICERLGMYDASTLDMDAPVVDSIAGFIAHHSGRRRAE